MNKADLNLNSSYEKKLGENASKIHFDSIVVDAHNDTMMKVIDTETGLPKVNIGEDTDFHIDVAKAQAGGLNVGYFAAFSDCKGSDDTSITKANSKTLSLINALYWTVKNNSETIALGTSIKKIKEAVLYGKIAAVPTIEGAYGLTERNGIELLNQYYDLGVRAIGYVWNSSNALGAGAASSNDMGLTELGYKVTKEMNRLGIIIDVSHMNEKTFWDVIKASEAPIIASHSCVYSLRNHVRNLTDEQIIALADIGGVININYWREILGDTKDNIDVKKLVDHIDYVVSLVGIDYVGLGSDFDGATMIDDIHSAADLPSITLELIKRGYTKSDIEKIVGLNNLRVMEEVEKVSEKSLHNISQLSIVPYFETGDIIQNGVPIFTAKVEKKENFTDDLRFRLIINGIVYEPDFNKETGVLSLTLEEQLLKENFHVVTFECKSISNEITRETRIVYVQ